MTPLTFALVIQAKEQRLEEGLEQHDWKYEKSGGLNHVTSNMVGEERSPW